MSPKIPQMAMMLTMMFMVNCEEMSDALRPLLPV